MLETIKSVNAALAFVLELSVLIVLGYWGFTAYPALLARIGLGIGLPLLAILIWGMWGAPRSKWRLQGLWFLLLRIVFFGSAVVALVPLAQTINPSPWLTILFVVGGWVLAFGGSLLTEIWQKLKVPWIEAMASTFDQMV